MEHGLLLSIWQQLPFQTDPNIHSKSNQIATWVRDPVGSVPHSRNLSNSSSSLFTNPLELARILSLLHHSSCTFFSSLVHESTLGCPRCARRHLRGNYYPLTSTWTPVDMPRSCVWKGDAADSNRNPGLDELLDSALSNVTTSDFPSFSLSKSHSGQTRGPPLSTQSRTDPLTDEIPDNIYNQYYR
jgi:hypothetical protein